VKLSETCHDIHNKVGNLKVTVTLVLAAFGTILVLTGYNINQTLQTRQEMIRTMGEMRTEIREDVARIGGQMSTTSLRIKHLDDRIFENRELLVDHEKRIQRLEKHEGE
jgi:peptidoglycan hydrolase CwlO-like protein